MDKDRERIENLKNYVNGVFNREEGRNLYFSYKDDLDNVTPQDAFEVFNAKLQDGYMPKDIFEFLDRVINVFHSSLSEYSWETPEENSFLDIMMRENRGLEKKLNQIRPVLLDREVRQKRGILLRLLNELEEFDAHYLKKENILFPYMEKKKDIFHGLTIMWSLHDEAREDIANMKKIVESDRFDDNEFNIQIGRLFFTLLGIVHKEEHILFPAAMEVIEGEEWEEMNLQSIEYGFPFIDPPAIDREGKEELELEEFDGMTFKTDTGQLTMEQILLIFNALPVDFTFVDEDNKVRYFSNPKDRLFPRSPAVIGRDVNMCHPAESVHLVEEIVDAFRTGKEDSASFWINLRGRMILIQYFALRDSSGNYKGVLEASQDITEIRELEGERRLLEWE
ncbi:MAG: PAS domain-containing protein [Tissierellaceae bacterium]